MLIKTFSLQTKTSITKHPTLTGNRFWNHTQHCLSHISNPITVATTVAHPDTAATTRVSQGNGWNCLSAHVRADAPTALASTPADHIHQRALPTQYDSRAGVQDTSDKRARWWLRHCCQPHIDQGSIDVVNMVGLETHQQHLVPGCLALRPVPSPHIAQAHIVATRRVAACMPAVLPL